MSEQNKEVSALDAMLHLQCPQCFASGRHENLLLAHITEKHHEKWQDLTTKQIYDELTDFAQKVPVRKPTASEWLKDHLRDGDQE